MRHNCTRCLYCPQISSKRRPRNIIATKQGIDGSLKCRFTASLATTPIRHKKTSHIHHLHSTNYTKMSSDKNIMSRSKVDEQQFDRQAIHVNSPLPLALCVCTKTHPGPWKWHMRPSPLVELVNSPSRSPPREVARPVVKCIPSCQAKM